MKLKVFIAGLVLSTSILAQTDAEVLTASLTHMCDSRSRCIGTFNSLNRVASACLLELIPSFDHSGTILTIKMVGTRTAFGCFAKLAR